ncbi:hypothetical protein [Bacillus cereus]|uniref:hypothetical protein n=1 Tax=Bacillus cereus TaxID=1396 RepID=UPI003D184589
MDKQRKCECNRCKRYKISKKWNMKVGDSIKVYSSGHLLKKWGTFLNLDYSFIKWLDEEQNIHFTNLKSSQIQKRK